MSDDTLRDDLLPDIDDLRSLPSEFGLRRYSVTLRTRTWSGGSPGIGTPTDTDTLITPAPKVRVMSTKEVADSGGTYRLGDFKVEKITPAYVDAITNAAGGYSPTTLQIMPGGATQDVVFVLVGDEGTTECTAVEYHFDKPFNYWMVLRARRSVNG